ncbi:uncharacterized protein TNIN_422931 [Trichonephila inaurata madagascariensis]|uniref:Uncharacterized protein n=1 Tax=Trichonephila inaurata madagascariensis TaxID=2747483 RepID=A0A8X6YAP8_9ARAC|nr:uncharacterized protein TNIN_422931 [Trichonephila inaurata madagascariensis]
MPNERNWREYARPIPFDEHHRRIITDRVYSENKARRQWEKKYGKRLPLYRADNLDQCDSLIKDKPCSEHTCGTSMQVGPPTTERMENETIIKTVPALNHGMMIKPAGCGWNQCEGIAQPFCPVKCENMVQPKPKQIKVEHRTLCDCPQQFRTLNFPPKCKRYLFF